MFATMYAAPGIGLAAPQVGVGLRFAVIDTKGNVQASVDAAADARKWLPGPFVAEATLPANAPSISPSRPLTVGLVDPWVGKPRVQFANALTVIDGWTLLTPIPK